MANPIGLAEAARAANGSEWCPVTSAYHEDVDDRPPDLIQERHSCQKYPLDKETFF